VTRAETPPSVVESGNASAGLFAGPRFVPKMLNMEPRAMEAPGKNAPIGDLRWLGQEQRGKRDGDA